MNIDDSIIEKILNEVDRDIKNSMTMEQKRMGINEKAYRLFPDPANLLVNWQIMRLLQNDRRPNTQRNRKDARRDNGMDSRKSD